MTTTDKWDGWNNSLDRCRWALLLNFRDCDNDSSIFIPPYHLAKTFIQMYKLIMDLTMWKTYVVFVEYNVYWIMTSTWNCFCWSTLTDNRKTISYAPINYQSHFLSYIWQLQHIIQTSLMISNHSWKFKWQTVIVGNISNHSNTKHSSAWTSELRNNNDRNLNSGLE